MRLPRSPSSAGSCSFVALVVIAQLSVPPRAAAAQAPVRRPVGALTRSVATSAATAAPDTTARRRNPNLAAVLSAIVPGAGQAYAGEPGRGLTFLAVAGSGLALAHRVHGDVGSAGAIVSLGAYVYAIIDAPAAVQRTARRAARRHAPTTTAYGTSARPAAG